MTNTMDSTIGASAARMAIYIIYVVNAFADSDGESTHLLPDPMLTQEYTNIWQKSSPTSSSGPW